MIKLPLRIEIGYHLFILAGKAVTQDGNLSRLVQGAITELI